MRCTDEAKRVSLRDAYKKAKKEAKKVVAETKNTTYKWMYERLETKEAEHHMSKIAKARERKRQDLEAVKFIKGEDWTSVSQRAGHQVEMANLLPRWKGHRGAECNGYKLWYSESDGARNGVGFLVSKELHSNVVEVIRHNDRIMMLGLVLGLEVVVVVCAYAPHIGLGDQEKKEFWDTLDAVVGAIPRNETICIGGDFNGHIGMDRDGFHTIRGRVWLCRGCKMQIDYLLMRQQDRRRWKDCKVIPWETVVTQHRLFVADIEMTNRLPEREKKYTPRICWGNLKDDKAHLFKNRVLLPPLV
ncbi:uncharacterized protein LOC143576685 [Bidens hawaiensis]|uniref:uncharacterized protein LOC143576685 n=1 Tax=Bidens hawaiensis TaxID=980011 RepID=UPI00404A7301